MEGISLIMKPDDSIDISNQSHTTKDTDEAMVKNADTT